MPRTVEFTMPLPTRIPGMRDYTLTVSALGLGCMDMSTLNGRWDDLGGMGLVNL